MVANHPFIWLKCGFNRWLKAVVLDHEQGPGNLSNAIGLAFWAQRVLELKDVDRQ